MTLVILPEDGLAELLHMTDDVPRLVFFNALLDIADEPFQDQIIFLQLLYQHVNSLFLHLVVIEFHPQVRREIQLPGQIAENGLKEAVDGFHAEITVVVQQLVQGDTRLLGSHVLVDHQTAHHFLEIIIRRRKFLPDAVELRQDAMLHLLGCLVGEGNGKDMTVSYRVVYE